MADFNAFPSTPETRRDAIESGVTFTAGDRSTTFADGKDAEYKDDPSFAPHTVVSPTFTETLHRAWRPHSYGDDNLFNRIWVYPAELDFGFITEESTDTFNVWNAFLSRIVQITAITLSGHTTGISLNNPATPIDLAATADLTLTVTLDAEGPPQQSSTYTLTVDGGPYTVDVKGIRVLEVIPEPDYRSGLDLSYEFQTVIFRNEYLTEQRRPRSYTSWRQLRAPYYEADLLAQDFFNHLSYGHDKVFAVPIYNEQMYPTQATQGTSTITISESNAKLWNLQNRAAYIALIDHTARVAEIKALSSVADTTLTTVTNIQNSFTLATTVVYPVFFGIIQGIRVRQSTDQADVYELTFREYIHG